MSSKVNLGNSASVDDIFWRSDLYPDAPALLKSPRLTLEQIKDDAVVILDANVLLQPYEVDSKELGNEIERVYKALAEQNRLIVPGQAVREYATNRPKKITAVVARLETAITRLRQGPLDKIPLLENDPDFVEIKRLVSESRKGREELISKLEVMASKVRTDVAGDHMATLYRDVIADCVIDRDHSKQDREDVVTELKRRQRLKVGPGFMDEHKDDLGVGDLIIWNEILAQGVARKGHCLFVSQETKPDWWAPEGGKFQLRPELVDEYRRASEGGTVHMVPLSVLLTLFNANPETVTEVADAEAREVKVSSSTPFRSWISAQRKNKSSFGQSIERLSSRIKMEKGLLEAMELASAMWQRRLESDDVDDADFESFFDNMRRAQVDMENRKKDISRLEHELAEALYSLGIEQATNDEADDRNKNFE